jgi:glucose/arabinose dehydrogenase
VGRPADVAFLADGSMLVSDDYGGRVWRIAYEGK